MLRRSKIEKKRPKERRQEAGLALITPLVMPRRTTRIKTKGFAGTACREASKFLETAPGTRRDETITAEFHQNPQQSKQQRT